MNYIRINPSDNVAVALKDLAKGEVVEGVTLSTDVPRGHKIVLQDLKAGDNVVKYGFPIGHVTRDAAAGTVVDHTCIKTNLEGLLEYKYEPSFEHPESPDSSLRGLKHLRLKNATKSFVRLRLI
ncbi:MAG: UxaA family hydrolase [Bacteroidales bacterium]|nr:UxaA family hydrolase [Bacteroidales bacterium]